VVEHLLGKHKALSSNPNTAKKEEKKEDMVSMLITDY
jgi:hypothetical protein